MGPIGDLMKPVKTDYLGVSEWLVGRALNTYLYFDDSDKHLLQKILTRNCNASEYHDIQLVKMRFSEEKISENPQFQHARVKVPGHYTIHDVFKYGHPMVERYLVEWISIHSVGFQLYIYRWIAPSAMFRFFI